MKNNLFNYATSELSQDAFICYLTSFAFEDVSSNPVLKKCAKHLIHLFVPEILPDTVHLLDIERQVNHIDVLITVEDRGKTYKIIIEDKTFTSEHDDQLVRYRESLLSKEGSADYEIRGVFYKTGFQCDLSSVEKAGYAVVSRERMLQFLQPYAEKSGNQIVSEYYSYWNAFQDETVAYREKPLREWSLMQVNGFYDGIKESLFASRRSFWLGYGYVANRAGGFYGLWTGSGSNKVEIGQKRFELYLQMETSTGNPTSSLICLKLSCPNDCTMDEIRAARDTITYDGDAFRPARYRFKRPNRLVLGKHMTIGVFDCDYSDAASAKTSLEQASDEYCRLLDALSAKTPQ